ncbi:hypothetical protein AVEN_41498-1 [Araneus ventricosus]|uniref:Uncharacterized protein n=1 Tax=Araneus ventricosus TaxID=182803 RepID=A0A4Y2HBV7_ARAVE|nr:hypothetical protein AVEN_41498-1 [Araneus ventricosus]
MPQKSFFCTEESLRNKLRPKRRLLYTLHLDIPHGREYNNLKYYPSQTLFKNRDLFVGVRVFSEILINMLVNLLEQDFERTDCKYKLLKWMTDFRPLESASLPAALPAAFELSCAKLLYNECVDSKFASKCFDKFIHLDSFSRKEETKVLEYLLYHARLCDFHVRSKKIYPVSVTDDCIRILNFRIVHTILK